MHRSDKSIDEAIADINLDRLRSDLMVAPSAGEAADGSEDMPNCNTMLPNGKTVGDMVRDQSQKIQQTADMARETGGSDMAVFAAELFAFYDATESFGPIDFKNNFQGQGKGGFLGAAGNFAYGAIASGIGYSQSLAEAGAGAYALKNGKLNLNNPFGEDNSAAQNLPAGYASNSCNRNE